LRNLTLTNGERQRLVAYLKTAPTVRAYRKALAILEVDRGTSVCEFQRGKPAKVPISGENAKRTVFGTTGPADIPRATRNRSRPSSTST